MPDSEGRSPAEAELAEAQAEFDYRRRIYDEALAPLDTALLGLLKARTLHRFPDGESLTLHGEYNEDGGLDVHIVKVSDGADWTLTTDDDPDDELAHFDEDNYDLLTFTDVFGEDYLGETEISLTEGDR